MKLARYISIIPLVLCFLAVAASADSKQEREVKLSDHVTVSGTQLEPGKYVVRWNASGPAAEVKFLQQGREVASVTGNVIEQKNRQTSFTTSAGENGSRVLAEIDFSDVTLDLSSGTSTAQ